LKAKQALPKGMRQISESERVSTLEELISTRKELNTIMMALPISMQTNGLKQKKRELEEKL
jgi:peroxiredoxin family protein